jgi:hypothetical protein
VAGSVAALEEIDAAFAGYARGQGHEAAGAAPARRGEREAFDELPDLPDDLEVMPMARTALHM